MSLIATEALIRELPAEKIRGLQKATVVADFDATTNVRVVMDGETAESRVMSAVGELQADQRVMVLFTEPAGAYIGWLLHPPAWRALVYGTGWQDFDTTFQGGEVRRVGDTVELRGLVERFSGAGTTIAELLPGFRPPKIALFDTDATGGHGRFDVTTAGLIVLQIGTATYVGLNGKSFSVTPTPS